MKTIFDILTGVALMVFLISLSAIEELHYETLVALLVSGSWLVTYTAISNELRREKEGRR